MRYAYYDKLNRAQQGIYRHSDRLETLAIPNGTALRAALEAAHPGPADVRNELHGLYDPTEDGDPVCITVWMYTA